MSFNRNEGVKNKYKAQNRFNYMELDELEALYKSTVEAVKEHLDKGAQLPNIDTSLKEMRQMRLALKDKKQTNLFNQP